MKSANCNLIQKCERKQPANPFPISHWNRFEVAGSYWKLRSVTSIVDEEYGTGDFRWFAQTLISITAPCSHSSSLTLNLIRGSHLRHSQVTDKGIYCAVLNSWLLLKSSNLRIEMCLVGTPEQQVSMPGTSITALLHSKYGGCSTICLVSATIQALPGVYSHSRTVYWQDFNLILGNWNNNLLLSNLTMYIHIYI
jgi:hypothetical protein